MSDDPIEPVQPVVLRLDAGALGRLECVAAGLLAPDGFTVIAPTGVSGADVLLLQDLEGVPRARLTLTAGAGAGGHVGGRLELTGSGTAPTYAELRLTPAQVIAAGGPRPAVVGADAPGAAAVRAASGGAPVLLLVAGGAAAADDAAHHRRVRGWLRLAAELGPSATLVLTPLPGDATEAERAAVAGAFSASLLAALEPDPAAEELQGAAVMLSGLSGSGKSTIGTALVALLTQERGRSVTLLDGDVVRTHLSSELGFSKADRDTNIRRIGWVAAEVAKHGGIAVCAPIAPYSATRAAVRALVEQQAGPGGFVLVHVATSLEECERRDRKGLYAKARAGLIPEFTGISDPYETPTDAELVIDTTDTTPRSAAEQIAAHLETIGRL